MGLERALDCSEGQGHSEEGETKRGSVRWKEVGGGCHRCVQSWAVENGAKSLESARGGARMRTSVSK